MKKVKKVYKRSKKTDGTKKRSRSQIRSMSPLALPTAAVVSPLHNRSMKRSRIRSHSPVRHRSTVRSRSPVRRHSPVKNRSYRSPQNNIKKFNLLNSTRSTFDDDMATSFKNLNVTKKQKKKTLSPSKYLLNFDMSDQELFHEDLSPEYHKNFNNWVDDK
jgi:hypothetical protein